MNVLNKPPKGHLWPLDKTRYQCTCLINIHYIVLLYSYIYKSHICTYMLYIHIHYTFCIIHVYINTHTHVPLNSGPCDMQSLDWTLSQFGNNTPKIWTVSKPSGIPFFCVLLKQLQAFRICAKDFLFNHFLDGEGLPTVSVSTEEHSQRNIGTTQANLWI